MLRAVVITVAAVVGMLAGFIGTFALVALTEHCPSGVRTCDIGPIAGAGLGFLVAPVTGILAGWLATWYMRKREGESRAPAI